MVLARFIKITEDVCVCVYVFLCVSTAHSSEKGSVQVFKAVYAVFLKETGGHKTAPATWMGCAFTQRPSLSARDKRRHQWHQGRREKPNASGLFGEILPCLTSKWSGGRTEQQCDLCKAGD